jgi:hypothetical protein
MELAPDWELGKAVVLVVPALVEGPEGAARARQPNAFSRHGGVVLPF